MNNLVLVTGDFCSGSTLLFTLFRKSGAFHCLYEPLHEKLPEYLVWSLRPDEHHFFVEDYFAEYKGFPEIARLHQSRWAVEKLYLPADGRDDALYRYLGYLIGIAFGRAPRVLLKENRFTFRSAWLRANFPSAKIVHIWRDCESQWKSVVGRGQSYVGKEDIGQSAVTFSGFNVARWCDDLSTTFPALRAENSQTGYDRFSKLWEASRTEGQRYADVSVNYRDLVNDFGNVFGQVCDCVGLDADLAYLAQFVVPLENRTTYTQRQSWRDRALRVVDRLGARYAKLQVRARGAPRG